jgi:hypothetical protein
MGTMRLLIERYGSLGLLLLAISAVTATIVTSCGGGGGSSNGGLCEQCGDTDGACQATGFVVPDATEPQPCPTVSGGVSGCKEVALICRRKSDSAQQRCYPIGGTDSAGHPQPDLFFRCDDSRPAPGTARPEPTLTLTPTPATTPVCNNGIIEGSEDCDLSNFNGATCSSVGCGSGSLSCNSDCTLNTLICSIQPCTP